MTLVIRDRRAINPSIHVGCGSNRRRAASIIDVVGAGLAIVLLVCVFTPALGKARTSSKFSRCMTNMMQLGAAAAIYSALDPKEMALPVHRMQFSQCPDHIDGYACWTSDAILVGAYEWGGKSGRGRTSNVLSPGSTDPSNSKYGTKAGFGPATRPMNSILYPGVFRDHGGLRPGWEFVRVDENGAWADTQLDLPINRCPSDTGYTGLHCQDFKSRGLTSYDHFGTSYNANNFTISVAGGQVRSASPYFHRLSGLLNPSRTVLFQENCGRFAWAAAEDPCDFMTGVRGGADGWHGKPWTFNATFVDGHAEAIYMRGYRPELVFPDDASLQNTFRCVIIRGDRWQLDTLPVPSVYIGLYMDMSGRTSFEGCLQLAPNGRKLVPASEIRW